MRTHTSPVQIRTLQSIPPLRVIARGRCIARFFDPRTRQCSRRRGTAVDEIGFVYLKATLLNFATGFWEAADTRSATTFRHEPSAIDGYAVWRRGGMPHVQADGWVETSDPAGQSAGSTRGRRYENTPVGIRHGEASVAITVGHPGIGCVDSESAFWSSWRHERLVLLAQASRIDLSDRAARSAHAACRTGDEVLPLRRISSRSSSAAVGSAHDTPLRSLSVRRATPYR